MWLPRHVAPANHEGREYGDAEIAATVPALIRRKMGGRLSSREPLLTQQLERRTLSPHPYSKRAPAAGADAAKARALHRPVHPDVVGQRRGLDACQSQPLECERRAQPDGLTTVALSPVHPVSNHHAARGLAA